MNVLQINRKQNVGTVEKLYSALDDFAPRCAIQVPNDLNEYRICGKGDFLQFLVTWSEKCPDAPIVTHIPPNASSPSIRNYFNNLFSEEHGFLLGLLARKFGLSPQRRFLNTRKEEIPTHYIEEAFFNSSVFLNDSPILKYTRAFLALDDIMNDDGRKLTPYTKVFSRRNPDYSPMKTEFTSLLKTIFKRAPQSSIPISGQKRDLLNTFLERVTQFTYEVFENAERWGARPYEKSVRGILVHLHFRETPKMSSLKEQVGLDNPLSQYLGHFSSKNGYERTSFLEVSIFDNGPSLATHFLGKDTKLISREYKATVDCLLLASGRGAKSTEGKGLYETMKLLNACKGFLRYRAKRLAVYRDFISSPLDLNVLEDLESESREARQIGMRKELSLTDWTSRGGTSTVHAKAVGALFTIIVPIEGIFA